MSLLERRRALMSQSREKYVFVEYIQSTGTQYIDTGLKTVMGKFEVDFARDDTTNTVYILGTRQNGISNTLSSGPTYNMLWQVSGSYVNIAWALDTNRHKAIANTSANKLTLNFDGTVKSGVYSINSNTLNVYLFGRNVDGALQASGGMKLYGFKYWNAYNELVRDFIPCYRKADKVGGLYDLVNDKFYENHGTGEFLIGGEI